MRRRFFLQLALGATLALPSGIVGCSGSLKTYPVEGQVTFPDGTPLTEGVVEFQSQVPEAKNLNAHGVIEADGTFYLTTYLNGREVDGALEGPHRVIVVSIASGGKPNVHPRFQNYDTAGLAYTVTAGRNSCSLQVERP